MTPDDAEVVVALAALFHDLGMSIHRADHEAFCLFVAQDKLRGILPELYDAAPRHDRPGRDPARDHLAPLRGQAADASRRASCASPTRWTWPRAAHASPSRPDSLSIHSVSAAAIEGVSLERGASGPISVIVEMSNSAGLFQLDQLLREKLAGSGLEPHLEIRARLGEEEKRLLTDFTL